MNLDMFFSTGLQGTTWEQTALALLTSFVLGLMVASVYEWTYEGVSYNRAFVQALALGSVVSAVLMLAIGDNLARGLGIMGTMALVRFRTNLRDARDMMFTFAALAVGVATGVSAFGVAVLGTIGFCMAAVVLRYSGFGARQRFDGLIRFWAPSDEAVGEAVKSIFEATCKRFVLVALRDVSQGEQLEYAYQVQLKANAEHTTLVARLERVPGLEGLTLHLQDAHTEL